MVSECYLAMTAAELYRTDRLPPHTAWMACHFSAYGTGLSNCPTQLPENALLIVDDSTPAHRHDPHQIVDQLKELLEQLHPRAILLDLQRPDCSRVRQIVKAIVGQLPCPVAVSEEYAQGLQCPVFLPPPPLDQPLEQHLAPWKGREIWLEAAICSQTLTLTSSGCIRSPLLSADQRDMPHTDPRLCCNYRIDLEEDHAVFTLTRTRPMLEQLMQAASQAGVTRFVGLYQQLGQSLQKAQPNEAEVINHL